MTTTHTTTSAMNPALYDARDSAGGRCQCRGECGLGHRADGGGGQCPTRDRWPYTVDLTPTPANAAWSLDSVHQLPAAEITMRCSACWCGAHTSQHHATPAAA